MATGIKPNQNSVLFECLGGGYSLEKAKHKCSKQTATGQDKCHTVAFCVELLPLFFDQPHVKLKLEPTQQLLHVPFHKQQS